MVRHGVAADDKPNLEPTLRQNSNLYLAIVTRYPYCQTATIYCAIVDRYHYTHTYTHTHTHTHTRNQGLGYPVGDKQWLGRWVCGAPGAAPDPYYYGGVLTSPSRDVWTN